MARDVYRRPELGDALAWLRDRARLTQRAAAAAAGLSRIYLQKLEAGERSPSLDRLDALLAAVGSDRYELEGLLAARPWAKAPPPRAVRSRARARPQEYIAAAEAALAPAQWSSPVAAPAAAASPVTVGELAELRDHFLNLPPGDRQALLVEARRRRFRG